MQENFPELNMGLLTEKICWVSSPMDSKTSITNFNMIIFLNTRMKRKPHTFKEQKQQLHAKQQESESYQSVATLDARQWWESPIKEDEGRLFST